MKNILFIVGSQRKQSFNLQLAKVVENAIKDRVHVTYLDYTDVPLFNQDLEADLPQSVINARKQVQKADALWVFTPEYNYNIPGVLKNLLDWLSRPLDLSNPGSKSVIYGKIVTCSGIGGKNATKYARRELIKIMRNCMMNVMEEPSAGLTVPAASWATNQLTINAHKNQSIEKQIEHFVDLVNSNFPA